MAAISDKELRKMLEEAGGRGKVFLRDGSGLYLKFRETAHGARPYWYYDYQREDGKRVPKAFGPYPGTTLADARREVVKFKAGLLEGNTPQAMRLEAERAERKSITFGELFPLWFAKRTDGLTEAYRRQITSRMNNHILPFIGGTAVASLDKAAILVPVREQEKTSVSMAHKILGHIREVLHFAVASGIIENNPAEGLIGALQKRPSKVHHPAVTDPERLGQILRAIDAYTGGIEVAYALKLMPYLFVRSGELRGARWTEIDLDRGLWSIPAERMKASRPHLVPLPRQAVELFQELWAYRFLSEQVFPSYGKEGFISPEALRQALFRCGVSKHEQDIHGFRGTASTLLREVGRFPSELIERQLAHRIGNTTEQAYDHSERLEERRAMLQWWADYLDGLKSNHA